MIFDEAVRYQESHEWARLDGNHIIVGISDYAQDELGDVVFVELPETQKTIKKGDVFGVVESVKAASDIYMPVSGEIVEVNTALKDTPEIINSSPFRNGWIIKIAPADTSELETLMDFKAYKKFTEGL